LQSAVFNRPPGTLQVSAPKTRGRPGEQKAWKPPSTTRDGCRLLSMHRSVLSFSSQIYRPRLRFSFSAWNWKPCMQSSSRKACDRQRAWPVPCLRGKVGRSTAAMHILYILIKQQNIIIYTERRRGRRRRRKTVFPLVSSSLRLYSRASNPTGTEADRRESRRGR
jgi:hypothetical protein